MEGIVLGQYVPGDSFLHRLDPRTKLITTALLVWVVFMLKTPLEYGVFGVLILFLYLASGVFRSLWRTIRPGIYLVIFTALINMALTPGHVILSLGIISFTREGMVQGLTMGGRLIFLIALSSLVTLTTSPVRMTDGLEIMMKPLKRFRFPTSELAMMMNIALRFIPTFWEEWEKIRKAQVSRGADFESWRMGNRIKYMVAMLIPLFLSAFRKADELSTAMESRGYVVGAERTSFYVLRFCGRDYAVMSLVIVLTAVFAVYRFGLFT